MKKMRDGPSKVTCQFLVIILSVKRRTHFFIDLYIRLNSEHGETEGDESPEAEENVSFLQWFSKMAVFMEFVDSISKLSMLLK